MVEDNPGVLLNTKLTLEFNNYEVFTAKNGKEGLSLLSKMRHLPDLIISDIMMPEMDGYEFFREVSGNFIWNSIPFIFLTARATPEDIRIGNLLGIDDYITKPFKKEDLLAIVAGKILRRQKIKFFNEKLAKVFSSFENEMTPSLSMEEKNYVSLSLFIWDESFGPKLKSSFPQNINQPFSIENVGTQLFIATASIYGQEELRKAQGLLLNIENIQSCGYIYFDSIEDEEVRGGHRRFMLVVIAPRINYFESLKIKKTFEELSTRIKEGIWWDPKKYWDRVSEILSNTFHQLD